MKYDLFISSWSYSLNRHIDTKIEQWHVRSKPDRSTGDFWYHQYFLKPISSTWYTPVSNWRNRPLLSGCDSSCSLMLSSCTGPNFRWSHTCCRRGGTQYPPVSTTATRSENTLWSTFVGRTQTGSFLWRIYWEHALEGEVVCQQYNGRQHKDPYTGQ